MESTPEASFTMDVAAGPGDSVRTKPARTGSTTPAGVTGDTSSAVRVKLDPSAVLDGVTVRTF